MRTHAVKIAAKRVALAWRVQAPRAVIEKDEAGIIAL
jgi:hypothetical protein